MDKTHISYYSGKTHTIIVKDKLTGVIYNHRAVPDEILSVIESTENLIVKIVKTFYTHPYMVGKNGEKKYLVKDKRKKNSFGEDNNG